MLINLYILSTKNFLLSAPWGEIEEPNVPSFLMASWFCPLGDVAVRVEPAGEAKERKEGKKQELSPMRS